MIEHELELENRYHSQNKDKGRFEIIRLGIQPNEVEVKLLQAEEKIRKNWKEGWKGETRKAIQVTHRGNLAKWKANDDKRRLVFRVLEWGWKGCGGYGGKRMIMLKHKGDRYLTKEKNELIDESFIC